MLVTQQPVLRRFWYPVIPVSHLEEGPKPFELLGEKIVLWLNESGVPAAVRDRCCHRSARLSQGKVIDGNIRCPYHGWSFNGSGACVKVPQLTHDLIPGPIEWMPTTARNDTAISGSVWRNHFYQFLRFLRQ